MKQVFVLLLCCNTLSGGAQLASSGFKAALSFNPTVLAATDNTAMLGVEYRLKNKLALVLDAGYIFSTYYWSDNVLNGTNGFSVRPGLKLCTGKAKEDFFQFQLAYKQVDYRLQDWLGKACVNGVPAYDQFQEFTYRKKTLSFNVLTGHLFQLSKGVLLELYAGFGIKIKDQRPTEKSACYRNNENNFIYNQFNPHSVTATVPLGIKILVPVQ